MKIRIKIEYDGTNYSGWQLQSGQDSIQARLEAALERIFGAAVRVHGSGRTDAGVHALGQVAAFELPRPFDPNDLKRAMNALLPPDIAMIDAAADERRFRSAPRRSICAPMNIASSIRIGDPRSISATRGWYRRRWTSAR